MDTPQDAWALPINFISLLQRVLSTPFKCTYCRRCVWCIRTNQRDFAPAKCSFVVSLTLDLCINEHIYKCPV